MSPSPDPPHQSRAAAGAGRQPVPLTMESHAWDERYAAAELVWSAEPNVFVADIARPLPAGRALDLACGEGRNAIWLARRGWAVTAVDFSAVATDKGRHLAEKAGVTIDWRCHDVVTWEPPAGSFDLVIVCYLQLPGAAMARVLEHARLALGSGGRLLVVGHARVNLTEGFGGPQDPALLYEPGDITCWSADLKVVRADHVMRAVDSPDGPRQAVDTLVVAVRDDE